MEDFAEIIKNVITSEELRKKEKELSDKETDFKKKCEEFDRRKKEYDPNTVERWKKSWEDNQVKSFCKKEIFDLSEQITQLENWKFVTIRNRDKFKEMLMYRQSIGYYVPFGETYLHEESMKNVRSADKSAVNQLISNIQGKTYKNREDFINPAHLVNLGNGVFDLKEEKLLEHHSKYYFQGILGIEFDKNATCPTWIKVIKGMFPDEESRVNVQKWFGYHYTRENREQIMHGIYGKSGSGKSQILKILRDLLGHNNVTNFDLQAFSKSNTYAIGRLYGKLANINPDMSTSEIRDISYIKMISSGDPVTGRNIYESPFEFVNFAKISYACNKFPYVVDDILEAREFQRRMMLTEAYIGHEKDDKDIYHKLRAQLPGIFNWSVEGYKLYIQEGFKYDKDIASIWRENMDMRYAPKNQHTFLSGEEELDNIFPKNVIKYD